MEAQRFWDPASPTNTTASRYRAKPTTSASWTSAAATSRPTARWVEFGCGTGTTAVKHAPYVKRVRALDISERMLGFGRDKAAAAGVSNVDFIQGTLFDLQLADNSVDVVLGLSILHLLPNRDETLIEVQRVLKPGGVFISSTACVG